MNDKDNLITIVAPVKNEKDNIAWTIKKIEKEVEPEYEILIVYDSDNDNTLPIAKKLQKNYKNIRLIKNDYGPGALNATLKGFDQAKGNILVMMAVDRTDDPETINRMYEKIKEGYDVVCPTRYSMGGKKIVKTSLKTVLSHLSGISTPYILGIPTSDLTYSYKMFNKKILKNLKIESQGGFEFAEELLIKAHFLGYKVCEVPTVWIDRTHGTSKFKLFKWLPRYIYWYLWGIGKRLKLH